MAKARGAEEAKRKRIAMGYDIVEAMTQIARQKNIEFDAVVETLEAGLLAAARKKYPDANNITFSFSKSDGEINMMAVKTVVEKASDQITEISLDEAISLDKTAQLGDEMEIYLDYEEFGRNAVASAKQILIQRVREAERVRIYDEYKGRVGKLGSGVVTQIDKTGLLVNLGNAEAFLPSREFIPRERFRQGDRLRAIITQVEEITRGPQITISRVSDNFLRALFELEVPEIFERVIEIKAISREPGERAKIAVSSIDDRIDPIGACVGMKGVRVQAVVRELSNERIDIVLYSSNSELFVTRSLAPAKVTALDVFSDQRSMTAAVEDEKLSLAIGRGGQNARLASRLTGWKINILSDKEYHMIKRRQSDMSVPV
ncbi:MAG: transcription termination factor NusA, partial [Candidatus Zixiibacteriota bacterium]